MQDRLASVHNIADRRLKKKRRDATSRLKVGDKVMERGFPGTGEITSIETHSGPIWVLWDPRPWSQGPCHASYDPLDIVLVRDVFVSAPKHRNRTLNVAFDFIEKHEESIKAAYLAALVFFFGYIMGNANAFGNLN